MSEPANPSDDTEDLQGVDEAGGAERFEKIREGKLEAITALGLDPWGCRFDDRQPIAAIRELAPPEGQQFEQEQRPRVRAAGRIVGWRDKGKLLFVDLADKTGRIQLMVGKKQVGEENWALAQQLDRWDLIGVDGTLDRSRVGEVTIFAEKLHLHAKTLAHPPDKHKGARDIEILLRRRYIDMIQNPAVVERFHTRSRIVQFLRSHLSKQGFIEVETPTMQAIAGGAAARPFITHHNALDVDFYLRIALELPLKRLLVGGMERVFEIGRVWRNEGIDASHNPEFTMMELYQAYGDYRAMMDLTEDLIVSAVDELGLGRRLPYGDATLDLTPPWRRATYAELFEEHVGVPMHDTDAVAQKATQHEIETAGRHPDVIVSDLFEACVEDALAGPIFVYDYPASICPLTKRKTGAPEIAERFELFLQGMEVANAYTELNDPILQEQLFRQQLAGLSEEDSMAKMDQDFVTALKHGMPPAGGLGVGIDRLVMLLTNSQTIRDVIIFPLLRPETAQAATEPEANTG